MAYPTGWGRKCAVVIQSSQVSASLTDFPVLLTVDTLPSEMFDADGSYPALSGGGDIRFSSDTDGNTQLACEVVLFTIDNDPANGTAQIWVKVPSVSSSADTTIYVWYNKSGETQPARDNTYGSDNVWTSNYKGVWHLDESSGTRYDSTVNANDLSDINTVTSGSGKFTGNSAFFTEANTEYLKITDANQTGLGITGDIYLSTWVKFTTKAGANMGLLSKVNWSSNVSYDFLWATAANKLSYIESSTGGNNVQTTGAYSTSTGNWYRVGLFHDVSAGTAKYIGSGAVVATAGGHHTSIFDGNGDFNLGAMANGQVLDGEMQEARVYSGEPSTSLLSSEYNNQNSPSTFAVEGTPEDGGGSPPASTFLPQIIMS